MKQFLLIIFISLFSLQSIAQNVQGQIDTRKTLSFNSNYITFLPDNGGEFVIKGKIGRSIPIIETLNGEEVMKWRMDSVDAPVFSSSLFGFEEYVYSAVKNDLKPLPNAYYEILFDNLLVDKTGKLVYFDFIRLRCTANDWTESTTEIKNVTEEDVSSGGLASVLEAMINSSSDKNKKSDFIDYPVPDSVSSRVAQHLYNALIKCPKFKKSAKFKGKAVPYVYNTDVWKTIIVFAVEDGKVFLMRNLKDKKQLIKLK